MVQYGLLLIPLALFISASVWMQRSLVKALPDSIDETDYEQGLGIQGTLVMMGMVIVATLGALYLIS